MGVKQGQGLITKFGLSMGQVALAKLQQLGCEALLKQSTETLPVLDSLGMLQTMTGSQIKEDRWMQNQQLVPELTRQFKMRFKPQGPMGETWSQASLLVPTRDAEPFSPGAPRYSSFKQCICSHCGLMSLSRYGGIPHAAGFRRLTRLTWPRCTRGRHILDLRRLGDLPSLCEHRFGPLATATSRSQC